MDDELRFVGGMRTYYRGVPKHPLWAMGGSATRPLAELLVNEHRIRLQLRYWWMRWLLGALMPRFDVRLDGAQVARFGGTFATRGVLLRGKGDEGDASAIFWCSRRLQRQVLDLLQQRGVTVD